MGENDSTRIVTRGGGDTRLRMNSRVTAATNDARAAAPITSALARGTVIKNRFLLEDKIGEGGMGVVFKARDIRNERYQEPVAIKFLHDPLQHLPDALEALQHEVRKAHELAHPNIVTVYEFDQDGPLSFIYMELLEGQPLDALLRKNDDGGLPFQEAWPIIRGAGTALAYAHERGIIHSDFKPGNVFITSDNRVKILDFGIARAARLDANEFDAGVLGALTPAYASPEMVLNLEPDARDDIYALACVSYELLAGRHPFGRMPAQRAQRDGLTAPKIAGLSRRRMRALERGLEFDRSARTPSIREFLADLEQKTDRSKYLVAVGAGGLALAAAAVGGAYWYSGAEECANVDRAFLDALNANVNVAQRDLDPGYRDLLMEQGLEYLAAADVAFDPALLSEGASHALGAFEGVLRFESRNAEAEAGIMRILDVYRRQANGLLAAGDAQGAAAIVAYGLKVHPQHCALNSLKERAQAQLD
jgi:serine/threonine protein kinase